MKIFLLFLFSWILPLCCFEEPLLVKLNTENELEPVYVLPFQTDESKSYTNSLQNTLVFDLQHNGFMNVVTPPQRLISFKPSEGLEEFGSTETWLSEGVHYVIKVQLENEQITMAVLDVLNNQIRMGTPQSLSGTLEKDRQKIHRMADQLVKVLFEKEGIASTKILYSLKNGEISQIWECDYDGKNARQITQENTLLLSPVYVPPKPGAQSAAFIYVSYRSGQPKMLLASLKNGQGEPLLSLRGTQLMPAISLQRDKIAFISDTMQNPDLFLQAVDFEKGPIGKPQQVFSAPKASQGSPVFSPDGKKIAFVSNKDGAPKIYVMDIPLPGANFKKLAPQLITRKNRENTAPTWSPDGKKIAYTARSQGNRQIWMYDFSTRQETQLTEGKENKENPSWASNSFHLVYNTAENKGNDLFFINLRQLDPVKITSGKGEKRYPNWEPRAFLKK